MKAGVIAVQGAVPEHLLALKKAMADLGINGEAVAVRRPEQLAQVSSVIIPGRGEHHHLQVAASLRAVRSVGEDGAGRRPHHGHLRGMRPAGQGGR